MKYADLVNITKAQIVGNVELDGDCSSFNTDSRTIQPGEIFIALKGASFDGHDFVNEVFQKGAKAAIVNLKLPVNDQSKALLVVEDTLKAYGSIAAFHAKCMSARKIAITGSCGKTTVKQMLMSVCSQAGNVCATQGNFNNDIGVPRTLLSINPDDDFAVVEMGANHKGEIAYLSQLLHADAVSIINADRAHLEGFGSIEGVAHAKGEIFTGAASGGISVLNVDEPFFPLWKELSLKSSLKLITCSLNDKNADIYVVSKSIELTESFIQISAFGKKFDFVVPFPGQHNIKNALIVIGISIGLGIQNELIYTGLKNAVPEKGRLNINVVNNGLTIIDDTYNANPLSVKSAINVLAQYSQTKVLILGDMGELGEDAKKFHVEVGMYAANQNIDVLLACGEFSEYYVEGFVQGKSSKAYKSQNDLLSDLPTLLTSTDETAILVKGSRFTKMENVVNALMQWGDAA